MILWFNLDKILKFYRNYIYTHFCEFSVILLFNIYKISEFHRNSKYSHFCFSELLILRVKKVSPIFCWAIFIKKNIQKIAYRRVAQKSFNFVLDADNQIFFWLTLYILSKLFWKYSGVLNLKQNQTIVLVLN